MKNYAFGVDIGGTTIKFGLFTVSGELIDKWEIETRTEFKGEHILDDIYDEIVNKLKTSDISFSEVVGIGLGVPGPVLENGTVLKCVNLGWDVVDVKEVFGDKINIKIRVGNDANVAALGEMWQGVGQGYKNIVMLTLGTGVGGGVVINGQSFSGVNGAAGEIGHIIMNDHEHDKCACGNRGCLEQYASATGIVRMTRKLLNGKENQITSSLKKYDEITAKNILDEARKGDAFSLEMVDSVGKMIGKSLALISCIINPEILIIGGGMAEAGEILFEPIRRYYEIFAFHASKDAPIKKATLGNNAGIFGCAKLVIE